MAKRASYEIADKMLLRLRERPATYSDLQRNLKTNYDTVKMHVEALKRYGLLDVECIERHPATGRPAHKVSLTEAGRLAAKRIR